LQASVNILIRQIGFNLSMFYFSMSYERATMVRQKKNRGMNSEELSDF